MLASVMDSRLENLSLSVDEKEELVLNTGEDGSTTQSFDLCLNGRFLTDRMINFNAMKHRLASVWRLGKGICIKEINKLFFFFLFFHIVDLKRVLEGGPWTFDTHLLILHHLKQGAIPIAILLFHVLFWIQVYDIPVGSMSLNVSKQLGNFIGKFVDYDINNNAGLWRNFMRIKVLLDVRQPLKRWKKIQKPQGEWPLVHFKYERLSTFCYLCGMLGHSEKFCNKLFLITDGDIKREWSTDLRVPVRRGSEYGGERWLRETMENSTHADDSEYGNIAMGSGYGSDFSIQEVISSESGGIKDFQTANRLPQILHGLQTFPTCTTKPTGSSHADGHVITSRGDNMGFKENGLEIVEDKKRRRAELFFLGHSDSMAIDSGERAIVSQVAVAANRVLETSSTTNISLAGPSNQACQQP